MKRINNQISLAIKLISYFLLIILIFSFFYILIVLVDGSGVYFKEAKIKCIDSVYFSFVTITTLGYGEMTPVGYARAISSLQAVVGLIYAGYSISQVVSLKQEKLIDYLANDRVHQTYNLCLDNLSDAKEVIADRRRALQAKHPVSNSEYFYFRAHPFFPALKSIRQIIGYSAHVVQIEKSHEMRDKINRAAHHTEEILGFLRKLINILNQEKIQWKTDRSVMILRELCEAVDSFKNEFIIYTEYDKTPYKGGKMYVDVVDGLIKDIREKNRRFDN